MDLHQLAMDESQNIPKFLALMQQFDGRVLPVPAFAVQATRLDGGMALIMSTHHAVPDGRSVGRFIDLWASTYRGSTDVMQRSLYFSKEAISLARPRGDELARDILKKVAPNLPVVSDYCKLVYRSKCITKIPWFQFGSSRSEYLGQHDGLLLQPTARTSMEEIPPERPRYLVTQRHNLQALLIRSQRQQPCTHAHLHVRGSDGTVLDGLRPVERARTR